MEDKEHGVRFWAGNATLGFALLILLNIGSLWEHFGEWAMGAWIVLAGVGAYLLMSDKGSAGSRSPD